MAEKNYRLDPIFQLYDPIRYSFNKKKEDYIIISPTVGSRSQLNDGDAISKSKTELPMSVLQTNTTLENNFFPSLFTEMVLEAGSNPIETIKHPGEFDTMLKTVLYPKNYDSVLGLIPDVGDERVLKELVRNVPNDANEDRMRAFARNTIERVGRADLERIDKSVKEGGFLPFLPLIFAGLAAAEATAGGGAGITQAINAKKAADAEKSEKRRHNMEMEKIAQGSGVADILGTVKEFGNRFSEETKKTVKEGLRNLIDKIDTGEMKLKHKGNAIVFKNKHSFKV
ncbi:hypothetical protein LOTGIDRAFT_163172 [Lottia gigantea]|uniref:Uncharacterized protein n=1 Tax=Lottia gigantea TaxID=225164 RepID=V4A518_LOTGI|nr:hypothetical protein LOTGIDRAFT_163172 [Lottia gigantea]ESO91812.1 hypothetical protein LOTGIDRAFT_163172 [Lottia gigantea]